MTSLREMSNTGMTTSGTPQSCPVLGDVVRHGFCSGCGVCAAASPSACLQMAWDEYGARVPRQVAECRAQCGLCSAVCPFGDHGLSEDDLAAELFDAPAGPLTGAGTFVGAYVGHVAAGTYRAEGSSGGLARWFLASLLEQVRVQRVMCVVPGTDPQNLFRFADLDAPEAVRGAAGAADAGDRTQRAVGTHTG